MAAVVQLNWQNIGLVIKRLQNLGSTPNAVVYHVSLSKMPNAICGSAVYPSLTKDCEPDYSVLKCYDRHRAH